MIPPTARISARVDLRRDIGSRRRSGRVVCARGDRLHLVGRNSDKLAEVARRCARAQVTTQTADFAQLDQNESCVKEALRALGRVDCVLIAHGDIGDQLASERELRRRRKDLKRQLQ